MSGDGGEPYRPPKRRAFDIVAVDRMWWTIIPTSSIRVVKTIHRWRWWARLLVKTGRSYCVLGVWWWEIKEEA